MTKYIDADALAEEMCKAICGNQVGLCVTRPENCMQRCMTPIFSATAADVAEVVHGEWIRLNNKKGKPFPWYQCSNCGCSPAPWECKPGNDLGHPPYCHGCGAKMDGEKEGA